MTEAITERAGRYEARTDGEVLQILRRNGVVVGEGRIGLHEGGFWIGEYTGETGDGVHRAVQKLFEKHEEELVAHFITRGGFAAKA